MSGDWVTAARREQVLHEATAELLAASDSPSIVAVATRVAADLLDAPDAAVRVTFDGVPHPGEILLPLTAPAGAALAVTGADGADEDALRALRMLADQVILALGRAAAQPPRVGERIQDALGGAPDVVLVVDGVGRVVKDNLSSADAAQRTAGRSLAALVHPDDAARAADALRAVQQPGQTAPARGRWRMVDHAGDWQTLDVVLLDLLSDARVCGIVLAGRVAAEPQPDPVAAEPAPPAPVEVPAGATVLVVDDHESNRRLVRRILEQAGYGVVEAGDGPEALERWADADADPDVVLTDVVLPGMSGRDLADRLRETGTAVPIVFMSGFGATVGRYGVDEVLEKPFSADRLVMAIESACR